MTEQVMVSGRARATIHLKVLAYHSDHIAQREKLPLDLLDLRVKTVLMPRQWFLEKLDPDSRRLAHCSRTEDAPGTARAQ